MNNYNTRIYEKQLDSKYLLIDPSYQRPLNRARVKKIVNAFNPLLVNIVKVSKRDDKYYIFDGQHTVEALKQRSGCMDVMVKCKVYEFVGMTNWEKRRIEADLFAEQNGISQDVDVVSKLRAKYVSDDKTVFDWVKTSNKSGLKLDLNNANWGHSNIVCYNEAFKAYNLIHDHEYLDMLCMIRFVWNGDTDSLRAEIIGGMALFYKNYYGSFDHGKLSEKLRKVNPWEIIRDGKMRPEKGKMKYCEQIRQIYNKGIRNKL